MLLLLELGRVMRRWLLARMLVLISFFFFFFSFSRFASMALDIADG